MIKKSPLFDRSSLESVTKALLRANKVIHIHLTQFSHLSIMTGFIQSVHHYSIGS